MTSFFRTLGLGVLYIVLLPFIAAFLALYAVFALLVLIVMLFRTIIIYFAGGSPFKDLPEDVEAKKIIRARMERAQGMGPAQSAGTTINFLKIDRTLKTPANPAEVLPNQENRGEGVPEIDVQDARDIKEIEEAVHKPDEGNSSGEDGNK